MKRRLMIVAHGSSVNPDSTRTVVAAARALATRADVAAAFDDIEARFLKQAPRLDAADWSADVTVLVPLFMADGYFMRDVLPRQVPPGVHITAPLGTADLSGVVVAMVEAVDPCAHLVLVGHGTERTDASERTVTELAGELRAELVSVTCSFIDQEPRLASTWSRVPDDGCPVVVVPYFAFAGPHTEEDIPRGLGLHDASEGPHDVAGHPVFYARPVGTSRRIADVLARLALAAIDGLGQ